MPTSELWVAFSNCGCSQNRWLMMVLIWVMTGILGAISRRPLKTESRMHAACRRGRNPADGQWQMPVPEWPRSQCSSLKDKKQVNQKHTNKSHASCSIKFFDRGPIVDQLLEILRQREQGNFVWGAKTMLIYWELAKCWLLCVSYLKLDRISSFWGWGNWTSER